MRVYFTEAEFEGGWRNGKFIVTHGEKKVNCVIFLC